MPRPDDSLCLHCNKKLPLYQRLKQAQFCSKVHEDAHRQQQETLGLERLFETHSSLYAVRPIGSIESILGPTPDSPEAEEYIAALQRPPVVDSPRVSVPEPPPAAPEPVAAKPAPQPVPVAKTEPQSALCLHCQKKLPLFRKLKNGQFCSKAHQEEYIKHQEQLGLERLFATHSNLQALRVSNGAESILGPEPGYAERPAPPLREEPSLEEVQRRLDRLAMAAVPKPTGNPVTAPAITGAVPEIARLVAQSGPDFRSPNPAIVAGDPLHFDFSPRPAHPPLRELIAVAIGSLSAAGSVPIEKSDARSASASLEPSEVWASLAALNESSVVEAFAAAHSVDQPITLPVFETARLASSVVRVDIVRPPEFAGLVGLPMVNREFASATPVHCAGADVDILSCPAAAPSWLLSTSVGDCLHFRPGAAPLVAIPERTAIVPAAAADFRKSISNVEASDAAWDLRWPQSMGPIADDSVWSWIPDVAGVQRLPWLAEHMAAATFAVSTAVGSDLEFFDSDRIAVARSGLAVNQSVSERNPAMGSDLVSIPYSGTYQNIASQAVRGTEDWSVVTGPVELPGDRNTVTDGEIFDELYAEACPLSTRLLSLGWAIASSQDSTSVTRTTGVKPLFRTVGNGGSVVEGLRFAAAPVSQETVPPRVDRLFSLAPATPAGAVGITKSESVEPYAAAVGLALVPQTTVASPLVRRASAPVCKLLQPATVLFRLAALGFLQPLTGGLKLAGNLILEQVPGEPILPVHRAEIEAPKPPVPPQLSISNLAFASLPSRGALTAVSGFWHNAPRDLKVLLFAIPLLATLAFRPTLPKISLSAPEGGGGGFGQALNQQLASLRRTVLSRAAVALDEDFRQGLDEWLGKGGATTRWAFDSNGFVQPGPLALYRPSMELTDYKMEFLGILDEKALSWVVRAADFQNYYVIKVAVVKPGPVPTMGLVRYAVIDGVAQDRVDTPVTIGVRDDMPFRITVNATGPDVSVYIQDQLMDSWSEPRLQRGGIGFFTGSGEKSRVRWVQVTHQYDALGRLCAYLAPYDIPNSTEGR